jgi:predicted transcriptional regulator
MADKDQVIRSLYALGLHSQTEIARLTGTSQSAVSTLCREKPEGVDPITAFITDIRRLHADRLIAALDDTLSAEETRAKAAADSYAATMARLMGER